MARIVRLGNPAPEPMGGKAEGLNRLIGHGFRVPAGFVILDASPGALPESLEAEWKALGEGPVAVRSSALDEDGEAASFAGQFATFLDVADFSGLQEAVEGCLASAAGEGAMAYRESRAEEDSEVSPMCVLVQKMVDARAAGVCFTADPVTSRRDLLILDSVRGLGEKLVSGEVTADHDVFERSTRRWRNREQEESVPVLAPDERDRIKADALKAETDFEQPLDMEWAIDESGELFWLQARPVTTLAADPRELDTPLPQPDDVWTRCNVGEMMPGAVSPLTFSTCARGIEMGWQDNAIAIGVQATRDPRQSYVVMFLGHLFINLSEGARFSAQVTGASADQQSLAICGRIVPEVSNPEPASWRIRLPRIARQLRQLLAVKRNIRRLEALADGPAIERRGALPTWEAIDAGLEELYEAYALHLQVSAVAGAMAPILLAITAGQKEEPSLEDHARVAELLAGAEDVESADVVAGLERLSELIVADPSMVKRFMEADPQELVSWLEHPASKSVGEAYKAYLTKHGHRSVRELDVRQPEWAEDPLPVIRALRHQVGLRAGPTPRRPVAASAARPQDVAGRGERILGWLTPWAHRAVRNRERAKSLLVATTVRFKRAYRALARSLVEEGRLPDEDAVFFLLHEELGLLCRGEEAGKNLAATAEARREALAYHETLDFADVGQGIPEAEEGETRAVDLNEGDRIVGKPVSRGCVEGRARVVHSLEEAQFIEPGEILVARITDVGWTPFFGVISGLVTDLGSAVSHGAVVAREYGLPAVLNTRSGTQQLSTGDQIRVDGDRGWVDVLSRAIPEETQG